MAHILEEKSHRCALKYSTPLHRSDPALPTISFLLRGALATWELGSFLTVAFLTEVFVTILRFFKGTSSASSSLREVVGVLILPSFESESSSDSKVEVLCFETSFFRLTVARGVSSSDEDILNPNKFFCPCQTHFMRNIPLN
ncbi:hypothetical protein OGAPHI_004302 [Ogataea philodendri]|uniref:Uncharacterized protein n=1 Tax=Ogataea philodendri TaxID=1378263 RepID=A0A9P8P5B9_9ASCO|nr:uncharacterized protein OGAPHI_004302 [Ogataea philodendri]KAH3666113.1 hypothetical protein OGAPHI_004302 [Ogataea philodendri]